MKANVILGKKQIVLASLVLILGAAVYLNWQFADKSGDLALTDQADVSGTEPVSLTLEDVETDALPPLNELSNSPSGEVAQMGEPGEAAGTDADDLKILGDAKLVNGRAIADETYFAMAKLARTKSRDAAIQTISTILDDGQLTEEDKRQVNERVLAITDIIEEESRIENLVKAKGFEECMVYLTDTGANVVVKTEGLDQDQATQIKNIVVSEGKVKGENISITEIN